MVVSADKTINVPEATVPTALEAKIVKSNKVDKHFAFNISTPLLALFFGCWGI
jgi:hypothetical protein